MSNEPIPMLLTCPSCGARHIDVGEFATKVHHTHACQSCGMVWRPAIVPTVGVQFLPGFKNEPPSKEGTGGTRGKP
jgi:rubredoxin